MAIQYWQDMSILVGSVQMAGHAKNVNCQTTVAPLDTTALSATGWTSLIGGNKTGTVDLEFMQDVAAGSVDATLWPYLGTSGVPHSLVTASADGSTAYLMQGIPLSYTPIEGEPGGLAMGRISGQASGSPVVRGQLIHPTAAARTSSSTGTAFQTGAVSATQRVYAALHVLAASGTTPSLTVTVQSDNASNFPSATARVSFAAKTDVGYEWSSTAGAITDDWWRVSYTISGTNPSFLFAVTVGIA